jgi:hypothetical protein
MGVVPVLLEKAMYLLIGWSFRFRELNVCRLVVIFNSVRSYLQIPRVPAAINGDQRNIS